MTSTEREIKDAERATKRRARGVGCKIGGVARPSQVCVCCVCCVLCVACCVCVLSPTRPHCVPLTRFCGAGKKGDAAVPGRGGEKKNGRGRGTAGRDDPSGATELLRPHPTSDAANGKKRVLGLFEGECKACVGRNRGVWVACG